MNATASTMMPLFGVSHLIPVFLLISFIGLLVYAKKSSMKQSSQARLGWTLAWVLFANFPVYVALQLMDGTITWQTALPLYPCPLASLLAPILVRSNNQRLFNVIFYWVFAGTLQAVVTPEIYSTFPHYEYFYFWVCHAGLLALLCFLLINQERQPTIQGVLPAFAWFNVMVATAAIINTLVGTNYYYLNTKPDVPTLIDHLGPWPWYILGVEGVALTFFLLSFGIFWICKNKLFTSSRVKAESIRSNLASA